MNTIIYTLYKTTNAINNKIYIGVHSTSNPNDSYLGSGDAIKLAIKKYGKGNFTKEILFTYDNSDDAYLKESQIVDAKFILRSDTYNKRIGGIGSNSGKDHHLYGQHHSNETKKIISDKISGSSVESTRGCNHHTFSGYWHTPFGIFETYRSAFNDFISTSTIKKWCKNPDKTISKLSISKSIYLTSLPDYPLGKTFKELGFWFETL